MKQLVGDSAKGKRVNCAGYARINCPCCHHRDKSHDTKKSLGVNLLLGYFRCFRCGASGNLYGKGDKRIEFTQERPVARAVSLGGHYPLWVDEARMSEWHHLAVNYLTRRGLGKYIKPANMHLAMKGRYAGRILLPHVGSDGQLWGWTARIIGSAAEGVPKVLYNEGMDRSRLYNDQALAEETDARLAVVEGAIDSLALLPNAVATLGKPTPEHGAKLLQVKRPVVFVLDGDTGNDSRTQALKMRMKGFKYGVGYVKLDCGVDPDDVDTEELKNLVNSARLL